MLTKSLKSHKPLLNLGLMCLVWGCSVQAETSATDAASAHSAHGMSDASPAAPPALISPDQSGNFITGQPFTNPPIIESIGGSLELTLKPQATPVVISGKRVNARVYAVSANGKFYEPSFMPPTIALKPGDKFKVSLINKLREPTNLHTHGFFVSPMGNQDNIFVDLLSNKAFLYNYDLPASLSTGSYWYHPHYHPLVEEQVFGGLSGFLYVRGLENKLPPDLQGIKQQFLGLKDFQLDRTNSIPARNINSGASTNRTINGQIQPVMQIAPGETQLWHIGNLGADIWYHLELPGFKFNVIAEDGSPVNQVWATDTLMMPPGKRFDVLVQAPATGSYSLITRAMSTGPAGDQYPQALMASVNVIGAAVTPATLPTTIEPFDDLSDAVIARKRIFDLSENTNTNQFFINQRMFSANQVDATPVTGTVEEWVFRNASQELHPIHMHVNDAQVMSIDGIPQKVRGLQDTIPIPFAKQIAGKGLVPGEVVMRVRFQEFVGPYVFHCHILAHEDNGMMTIINVTSPDSQ